MNFCDSNIECFVREKNYDRLNVLPPATRFAKKFRLELEALDLEIKTDDEIIGWFKFENERSDDVVFDDEKTDGHTRNVMDMPESFGSKTNVDKGHTLVDYGFILNNGLAAYEKRIDEEVKKYPDNEYLAAMKSTMQSIKEFLSRMVSVIDEKIVRCDSDNKKLYVMRDMLKKVPYYPAGTFREAVQSVWIIHFLLPLAENAWYSISLGKFDEYMYPFYVNSLKNGMTVTDAKKIMRNLYRLLNAYADGACMLNIGGVTYNELAELIIECQKEFSMPAPILGARVDRNTPDRIWNILIDEKLFSMGQPTFYGEETCKKALREKGVSERGAEEFSNNSCMGISVPAEEFNSMWGCVFTVPAALETALNKGKILKQGCKIHIPDIDVPENIDDLLTNFEKCVKYLMDICVKSYEAKAELSEKTDPDCFVSILTKGCIEKRCDRISGAKYHNVTVECMGMVNVADGICAIDKLVFRDKKYTLDEINQAVKSDFIEYKEIKDDLQSCMKYGENSGADEYAVKTAEIMQRIIRSYNHDNLYFLPSLHTLDHNVMYGKTWGAGYDGRNAGEPFAKNAGPSNEVRKSDPTSMVLSAIKLPQYKFFGGQPIDVNFQTDAVRNHKEQISALIKVYLENGGLQFQVNSLSSKLLREAIDAPDMYPNLVVRIGGFSIYFNSLSLDSKKEFAERFEKEGF